MQVTAPLRPCHQLRNVPCPHISTRNTQVPSLSLEVPLKCRRSSAAQVPLTFFTSAVCSAFTNSGSLVPPKLVAFLTFPNCCDIASMQHRCRRLLPNLPRCPSCVPSATPQFIANQPLAGISIFFAVKMCILFLPAMFMGLMTLVGCCCCALPADPGPC